VATGLGLLAAVLALQSWLGGWGAARCTDMFLRERGLSLSLIWFLPQLQPTGTALVAPAGYVAMPVFSALRCWQGARRAGLQRLVIVGVCCCRWSYGSHAAPDCDAGDGPAFLLLWPPLGTALAAQAHGMPFWVGFFRFQLIWSVYTSVLYGHAGLGLLSALCCAAAAALVVLLALAVRQASGYWRAGLVAQATRASQLARFCRSGPWWVLLFFLRRRH